MAHFDSARKPVERKASHLAFENRNKVGEVVEVLLGVINCRFYILAVTIILVVLFVYYPSTSRPGLLIVLLGMPIYLVIQESETPSLLS